jgi:hypothetical protein
MRIRWTTRIATAAGLLTLVAGVAAGGGSARAAARPTAPAAVGATAGYVTGGQLNGVAAISAGNAWAVGYTGWPNPAKPEHTLLMHWNGKAWLTVTTPKPVAGGFSSVSVAGGDAWAVGTAPVSAALIWHWNGKSWAKSATPSVPGGVELLGVAQTSASTAWAGGEGALNGQNSDLLLRWNGRTWSRGPVPDAVRLPLPQRRRGGT